MRKKTQFATFILLAVLVLASLGCIQKTVTDVPVSTPEVSGGPSPQITSVTEKDIAAIHTEIAELKAVVELQGTRITELEGKEISGPIGAESDPMVLSLAISDVVQSVQPAVVFISAETRWYMALIN